MASVDVKGLEINAPVKGRMEEVLTPEALEFVAGLHREFDSTRRDLLERRAERQAELDKGGSLDFRDDTRELRPQHLDRDETLERTLASEIHRAHPSLPERSDDLVLLSERRRENRLQGAIGARHEVR